LIWFCQTPLAIFSAPSCARAEYKLKRQRNGREETMVRKTNYKKNAEFTSEAQIIARLRQVKTGLASNSMVGHFSYELGKIEKTQLDDHTDAHEFFRILLNWFENNYDHLHPSLQQAVLSPTQFQRNFARLVFEMRTKRINGHNGHNGHGSYRKVIRERVNQYTCRHYITMCDRFAKVVKYETKSQLAAAMLNLDDKIQYNRLDRLDDLCIWISQQDWLSHKSVKLFDPESKVFQSFYEHYTKEHGTDFFTDERV
jgi:hypothetical protein